ncbi:MAG: antibiotic biosynthesis monooxygenase [Kineosporiaceae bacterium]|nr:antibiotic biosynthesis monooxygenase [Kineosporiaceae bacterium]MBK8073988.1 antibiotic biosynthesis monooxygenase [Kineosporiaceae bacterium]
MVVEQVELVVSGGQEAAFEAALCEVRQRVFASPGFRGFAVAQGLQDHPATYLVQVRWQTPEELAAHMDTRSVRCWAPVEPYLAGTPRVTHYLERPSLDLNGPGVITDLAWLTS